MSFETTVSGPVSESVLPNGDVEIIYHSNHGVFFQLIWLIYFLFSIVLFWVYGFNGTTLANAALCAGGYYLLINKKQTITVVPKQGIRFNGDQIAFEDISTIRTVKNTSRGSKLYLVVRGRDIFLAESNDALISALTVALKSHSTVQYT